VGIVKQTWDSYLKDWHIGWLKGLLEFHSGMSVLDVGAGRPRFMRFLRRRFGCDVHALDVKSNSCNSTFGFRPGVEEEHPEVMFHYGLAGEDLLPADSFDLVTCISVLEHTYDHNSPVDPDRPLPHLNSLRDMVRMLKPGGALLMNWDYFLSGRTHNVGYDFESDYQFLRACGLRPFCNRRAVRGQRYIFDHPDTLFFDHAAVMNASQASLRRGSSINLLWRKPGSVADVRFRPHPELERLYFPESEVTTDVRSESESRLTTDEIEMRFRTLISRLTDVLGRRPGASEMKEQF
jgi:SAM-dependent methyltransferase